MSFDGRYYRLDGAHPGPRPAHPIGIWLGAFKPRMIRLVGRKACGWLPSLGLLTRDELRAGNQQIDAAAEKAGRDPRSIRRIINLHGLIGEQPAPSRSELPVGYLAGEPLAGPAEWWVETLAGFVDDGFDTLVFWPVDVVPGQVELLAGEVAPHFRPVSTWQFDFAACAVQRLVGTLRLARGLVRLRRSRAGTRSETRCPIDRRRCQRRGSRSAPQIAQPAA